MHAGRRSRHADGGLSAHHRTVFWLSRNALPSRDHLIGGGGTCEPTAMRGREIMRRTRLAGEKQSLIDRLGEHLPAIRQPRQRARVRPEREWIETPAMHPDRFKTAGKIAAEQIDQL